MRAFYENRLYNNILPVHANTARSFSFLAHWHTDIEIIMVLNGRIQVGIDQDEKVLNEGEAAVSTSGQIHFYKDICKGSEIILTIFHPRIIGFPDGWPKEHVFSSPFILRDEHDKSFIDALRKALLSLNEEAKHEGEWVHYMILARVYEIAGLMTKHAPLVPVGKDFARKPDSSITHQILRYIDERYMTNLTLEKIANEFNVSPPYLSRLIKKTSGMNFLSYLANRRLLQAEYLLRTSGKSITEIAFDCGFESIRTFNRIFRDMNSLSPSEYRKSSHLQKA